MAEEVRTADRGPEVDGVMAGMKTLLDKTRYPLPASLRLALGAGLALEEPLIQRGPAMPPWLRRTNVWRKIASPPWAKRLRSGAALNGIFGACLARCPITELSRSGQHCIQTW